MKEGEILTWLMQGDPAIAFQTARDLLGENRPDLQARMASQGWGKALLECRNPDGGWGLDYYRPKWACTHYVLLELAMMEFPPDHPEITTLVAGLANGQLARDGGFGVTARENKSDVCITGMFLMIASHFGTSAGALETYVDFLLQVQLGDGGFNCQINRSGCTHSSLHSTLSVLEGFQRYETANHTYRISEVRKTAKQARDFILKHRFYKSDRTGQVISPDFLRFPYPARWRYNILRALDHFRASGQPYHAAMDDALEVLLSRRRPDGLWPRMAKLPGKVFFDYEPPRGPSRWNTLQALRVLKAYPRI